MKCRDGSFATAFLPDPDSARADWNDRRYVVECCLHYPVEWSRLWDAAFVASSAVSIGAESTDRRNAAAFVPCWQGPQSCELDRAFVATLPVRLFRLHVGRSRHIWSRAFPKVEPPFEPSSQAYSLPKKT